MKQRPSSDMFVIYPDKDKSVKQNMMTLGETSELKGMDAMLLRVEGKSADPKSNWNKVKEESSGKSIIQPVLIDEDGLSHYPDGKISVRFYDKLSDTDLQMFGKRHGLDAPARNPYVPEQVTFQLSNPREDYIVDVVKDVTEEEGVRTAWANTFSRYERG